MKRFILSLAACSAVAFATSAGETVFQWYLGFGLSLGFNIPSARNYAVAAVLATTMGSALGMARGLRSR